MNVNLTPQSVLSTIGANYNLVWNADYFGTSVLPDHWSAWGSPTLKEIVEIGDKQWLHVKANTRWQGLSQNWTNRDGHGDVKPGEKVTLSFYAFASESLTSFPPVGIHWNNSAGTIVSQNWLQCNVTTTPQQFYATFTVPSGVDSFNIMVGNGSGTENVEREVWVAEVKLERGEIITPFSPASGFHEYSSQIRANNINPSKVVNRGCTSFSYNADTGIFTLVAPVYESAWGVGFYINDITIRWPRGATWLISMDVFTDTATSWMCDINNKPDLADVSAYTGNDYDATGKRTRYADGVLNGTLKVGWNKVWFTQTATQEYGLYNYVTNFGIVTTNLSNPVNAKIKNLKGEIIEPGQDIYPTEFIPNKEDKRYHANVNGYVPFNLFGTDDNVKFGQTYIMAHEIIEL